MRPRNFRTDVMTATVYDQGAQVVAWAPTGTAPALWLSPRSPIAAGQPIRGGAPICFPWFAASREGGRTPNHGFARTTPWRLISETSQGGEVVLDYQLTDADASAPSFAVPYCASYRLVLGSALELTLTVTNTGNAPMDFEAALHPYLAVGDIRRTELDGLDGDEYDDVANGGVFRQSGPLLFAEHTSRIYRSSAPLMRLTDRALQRTLLIETIGATNIILWNPFGELAKHIADIGEQSWDTFVCVEAANILENAVTLQPGRSHTLGFRLSVAS